MSYIGRSSKLFQRAYTKVSFLATAGQTSKTGLSYTPTFVEVYVNGVLLTDTTDFTATNGNSVTFTVALLLNDEVTVVSLKTFTVADHYNKSEADTLLAAKSPLANPSFTGNVGIGTSSPSGLLHLQSSAPAMYITDTTNNTDVAISSNNSGDLIFNADLNNVAASTNMQFKLDGSEAMRIDSSGNVGIGTSSPAQKLTVFGTGVGNATVQIEGEGGADPYINFLTNNAQHWSLGVDDSDSDKFKLSEHSALGTNDYLTVDVTGNVGIGRTSQGIKLDVLGAASGHPCRIQSPAAGVGLLLDNTSSSGTIYFTHFRVNNVQKGQITSDRNSVTYGSNSDYRLKENVVPMTGATEAVKLLKPVNFDWIETGDNVNGFLAHELAEVVPEAATGTKDAMMDEEYEVTPATGDVFTAGSEAGFTEVSPAIAAEPAYYDVDGNVIKAEVIAQAAVHEAYDEVAEIVHFSQVEQPETLEEGQQWRETTAQVMGTRSVPDMQGIDQSKLVPLLTATIQELIARIETLEQGE